LFCLQPVKLFVAFAWSQGRRAPEKDGLRDELMESRDAVDVRLELLCWDTMKISSRYGCFSKTCSKLVTNTSIDSDNSRDRVRGQDYMSLPKPEVHLIVPAILHTLHYKASSQT
jgi:hypothetical protein